MARQIDMVENDLNSVIASAVQARIETAAFVAPLMEKEMWR